MFTMVLGVAEIGNTVSRPELLTGRMSKVMNPFLSTDPDRHEIWDMLVRRDIEAFAANDWQSHRSDFLSDNFFAMDAKQSDNPDSWNAAFSNLDTYAENWAGYANSCFGRMDPHAMKAAHLAATTLRDIEINGNFAAAHKKFDGRIQYPDGTQDVLNWQTLYFCRKAEGRWWIAGFIGYLPNPMGTSHK